MILWVSRAQSSGDNEVSGGNAVCQAGECGRVAHRHCLGDVDFFTKGFEVSMKHVLPYAQWLKISQGAGEKFNIFCLFFLFFSGLLLHRNP